MSYTVFALKWRPKSFDEVIGQNHITSTLKGALQNNRLAHAFLFSGPRGVGKTSTARILAKALNCKAGPTQDPCQKCPSCIEISEGRSLDVIEIDGASNRGIDEIRVLRENVKFAPASGKYKVYIIDEVHMLTTEAFNALLKTLEEPPEFVKFIFATTQPQKVIPTILSRCHRFDFRRITAMEIARQLERIVNAEKLKVDKDVLFAIARSSDGSMRDAESVLDQLISFSRGKEKVSLKDVVSVLGVVEQEALFEIADKIAQKDAKAVLALFNSVIDNGKDISVFLNNLIEHFRNLMVVKVAGQNNQLVDFPQEICDRLSGQSQVFSLEEIFSAFNTLVGAQEMGKRLDSLRIPLEIGLVKLAHDKKGERVVPVKEQVKTPPKAQVKESAPEPPVEADPKVDPPEPDPAVSLDKIIGIWQNVIDALSKVKMSVATYLNEGEPLSILGNTLTISFAKNYSLHKEALEEKANCALIEKTFSEMLSAKLRINFILSAEEKQKEIRQDSAFIKSALDVFGGRVIKEE
ncbi:MAG: DNA polymerase III subunit gamma/tau [Candidatus Omnitrophica bacterium]|nr:DNA polymerase III subunit gamma/tau [Candidatus Omnitrophota bacterium]